MLRQSYKFLSCVAETLVALVIASFLPCLVCCVCVFGSGFARSGLDQIFLVMSAIFSRAVFADQKAPEKIRYDQV